MLWYSKVLSLKNEVTNLNDDTLAAFKVDAKALLGDLRSRREYAAKHHFVTEREETKIITIAAFINDLSEIEKKRKKTSKMVNKLMDDYVGDSEDYGDNEEESTDPHRKFAITKDNNHALAKQMIKSEQLFLLFNHTNYEIESSVLTQLIDILSNEKALRLKYVTKVKLIYEGSTLEKEVHKIEELLKFLENLVNVRQTQTSKFIKILDSISDQFYAEENEPFEDDEREDDDTDSYTSHLMQLIERKKEENTDDFLEWEKTERLHNAHCEKRVDGCKRCAAYVYALGIT